MPDESLVAVRPEGQHRPLSVCPVNAAPGWCFAMFNFVIKEMASLSLKTLRDLFSFLPTWVLTQLRFYLSLLYKHVATFSLGRMKCGFLRHSRTSWTQILVTRELAFTESQRSTVLPSVPLHCSVFLLSPPPLFDFLPHYSITLNAVVYHSGLLPSGAWLLAVR
jgi:hypothetical protein